MSSKTEPLREFGPFRLDARRQILWYQDQPVSLALKEIELLSALTENAGDVYTKQELLDRVWSDSFVEESNLSRHVYVLRQTFKKFGCDDLIETVPRRGYRFTGKVVTPGATILERHAVTTTLVEEIPAQRSATGILTATTARMAAAFLVVVAAIIGGVAALQSRSAAGSGEKIRSLAILPFNLLDSHTPADESGIGMADLLITRLSNLKEINVRPTTSVLNLKGADSLTAGRDLSVDAVLEGTIMRTAEFTRVTARLLRVSDGTSIWAGHFEKPVQDEVSLQGEIAAQLINAISISLNPEQTTALTKRFSESSEANDLYVRGRVFWSRRDTMSMLEAERNFSNAIAKDPNFALAYVGLADTYVMRETEPGVSVRSINKALELDPNLGEAYATLGFINTFHYWNWAEAENLFCRSIELRPGYGTAHHWYATLLAIEGRFDEAKAEMHRALEIDPLSKNFLADLGQIHYFAGEFQQAEEYIRRALAIDPDFALAHRYLGESYLLTGDLEQAAEERVRFDYNEDPRADKRLMNNAIAIARQNARTSGRREYLLQRVLKEEMHPNYAYYNASLYALAGENEKALTCLESANAGKSFLSAFIKAEPAFASLRSEERYQNILRKMGLTVQ
jgi:DNA-binding winged helix-turn-helix (wHTH) protein/TolB-like protein/Tfp pilus assembly protein PilF